ncbi:MAG: hypothetical protein EBZ48_01470 [Proteobacteria bacterium]|nr:hypothetical protein [Pseudomonadota bacterium]
MGKWFEKCRGFMPRCFSFSAAPSSFGLRSLRRPSRLDLERIWREFASGSKRGGTTRRPTRLDLERIWREREEREALREEPSPRKNPKRAA